MRIFLPCRRTRSNSNFAICCEYVNASGRCYGGAVCRYCDLCIAVMSYNCAISDCQDGGGTDNVVDAIGVLATMG